MLRLDRGKQRLKVARTISEWGHSIASYAQSSKITETYSYWRGIGDYWNAMPIL